MTQFYSRTLFTLLFLFSTTLVFAQSLTDLGPTQGLQSNSTTQGFNIYNYTTSSLNLEVNPITGVPYVAYLSSGGSPVIQKYVNGSWQLDTLISTTTNAQGFSMKFTTQGARILAITEAGSGTTIKKVENGIWSNLGNVILTGFSGFSIMPNGDFYCLVSGRFKKLINSEWSDFSYPGTETPSSLLYSDGVSLYGLVFISGSYVTYLKNYSTGTKEIVVDNGSSAIGSDAAGNLYVWYGSNGSLLVAKMVNGSLQQLGARTYSGSSVLTAKILPGKDNSVYSQVLLSSSAGLRIDISKLSNSTLETLATYEINKYNSYANYSYSAINRTNDDIYIINPSSIGAFAKKYTQPIILPVSSINFKAAKSGSNVQLSWSTLSEVNNDHFVVEKGTGNNTYKELAMVSSRGSSLFGFNYAFTDTYPEEGLNYYRLSQVDKDGTKTILDSKQVDFSLNDNRLAVYPNPVESEQFEVVLPSSSKTNHVVKINALNGQTVFGVQSIKKTGEKLLVNTTTKLPQGLYILEVEGFEPVRLLAK